MNQNDQTESMSRVSMFLPDYLEDILTQVSIKEGAPKAEIVRRALLSELEKYLDALDKEPRDSIESEEQKARKLETKKTKVRQLFKKNSDQFKRQRLGMY
tara:strand:+ start:964 stop:1263 length:300 start_codon:yes stop_codon:yes gene_type:complete